MGSFTMDGWKRTGLYLAALLTALHCRPGEGGRDENDVICAEIMY